jgi:S-formylglutathione hydrolase FrmB
MPFCQFHWNSQVLQRQTTTWLLLPEVGQPPFATFYLLHGLSDDHTRWMRQTRIEAYIEQLPLIVVMPDGGRGFYTNHTNGGPKWATHITEELPAVIERYFPARQSRDARCIGGLSMGGYGALRLALAHPERYVSANSHSGALLGPSLARGTVSPVEYHQILGDAFEGSDNDPRVLALRAKTGGVMPKLRIDCGTEDHLLDDNRRVHRALVEMGVEHEYVEYPGMHEWAYWDTHMREALAFHAQALGLT